MSQLLVITCLVAVSLAHYDAYVTANGTDNTICSQSTPCGLFQYVIRNIVNSHIPDDDLTIYINGSDPFAKPTESWNEHCSDITLTGNITFILDPNTIHTAADWFGAGVLDSCGIDPCSWLGHEYPCSYNIFTVDYGANVVFDHLVWDHWMPLLQSLEQSTFHCVHCILQNIDTNFTTFLLSNEAIFSNSTFHNLTYSIGTFMFDLFPIYWLEENAYSRLRIRPQETDSVLTLTGCSISEVTSRTFINIIASNSMLLIG